MVLSRYNYSQKKIYSQAGNKLINVISQSLCEQRKILLFLSGGSSINLYGYLAEYLNYNKPSLLSVAQVDERFQPENRNDINAEAMAKTGLRVPYYIVHQDGTLSEAVRGYNSEISQLMVWADYKMAILGIGEDCHTAGLIPGYEKDWNIDRYIAGYDLQQGKFRKRITITPKLMEKLDYALIVAKGAKKKEAVKNALKKENLENLNKYPAAIIQKIPKTDLFLTFDL